MSKRSVEGDVTLEGLETRTFTTKIRGYDPDEVQEFLGEVAEILRDQKKQANRAYQAVGEEMGDMLQEARDRADAMIADAEQRAADTLAQATAAADETRTKAQAEAASTRSAADDDAARARAEAEQAAARLTADATRGAEDLRAQAQQDADDRTARADARVGALLSEEDAARKRVRALAGELRALSQALHGLGGADGVAEDPREAALSAVLGADLHLDPVSDESPNPAT